jgi:hypothetical protein|tara:strand:+ start:660 stop:2069 length:1410 start_codon:yes stop_codon:yes gene_type:complete
MSYESPKYINQSQADLFQNLQDTINTAVTDSKKAIAAEKVAADTLMNENIMKAGNASAAVIKDIDDTNYGDEFRTTKVDSYFDNYETSDGRTVTYAERAKELTMEMNQKPRPENYGDLKAELDFINSSPQTLKTSLDNLTSQFDFEGRDIDLTGNSDALLAAYIIQSKPGFGKNSDFDYKIRRGPNNSIEYVFSGSGTVNGKEVSFKDGEYVVNSNTLQDYEDNNKEFLVEIPNETEIINTVVKDSDIFKGAEYNDKGEMTTPGDISVLINDIKMDGDVRIDGKINEDAVTVMKFEDENGNEYKYPTYNVDKKKLRSKMQTAIDINLKRFLDPTTGNIDEAKAYWNNRLAASTATEPYDIDIIRESFGKFPEVVGPPPMSDDDLRQKWEESIAPWENGVEPTPYQLAAFHRVYTDRTVNEVYDKMMSPAYARQRIAGDVVDESGQIALIKDQLQQVKDAEAGSFDFIED